MYQETVTAVSRAARGKADLLKRNPPGYFIASMLAGAYIGFGVLLSFTIGGLLSGEPYAKIVMGVAFGVALSLVVMAGAELFTGNNLVMSCGALEKSVSWEEAGRLWLVCWIGNLAGAVLLALAFRLSGLFSGSTETFMLASASAKMTAEPLELFFRGALCNTLVCLAVWCGFRCASESGKLIMIFWCLFAFITSGFEHSIANMTLLTLALFSPGGTSLIGGWVYNLLTVTLGNMAGGVLCVALPYWAIARKGR